MTEINQETYGLHFLNNPIFFTLFLIFDVIITGIISLYLKKKGIDNMFLGLFLVLAWGTLVITLFLNLGQKSDFFHDYSARYLSPYGRINDEIICPEKVNNLTGIRAYCYHYDDTNNFIRTYEKDGKYHISTWIVDDVEK